jgi:hypothetical protein
MRAPCQYEGCPAVEQDAVVKGEALQPIRRDRRAGLRWKQPRQHDASVRRNKTSERPGEPSERLQQDVRKHEIVGGARAKAAVEETGGPDHLDERARFVCARVLPRGRDSMWVNVARKDGTPAGARRRDGEHAAAGADVENTSGPTRLEKTVEREQTAARRAVMAGAEGQRRLDFDAGTICADARAVVAAVHDETARRDRLQPREAVGDPIAFGNGFEGQRTRGRFARCRRYHLVHSCAVEWAPRIERDDPIAVGLVNRARGVRGIEVFSKQISDPPRRPFISAQA